MLPVNDELRHIGSFIILAGYLAVYALLYNHAFIYHEPYVGARATWAAHAASAAPPAISIPFTFNNNAISFAFVIAPRAS